MPAPSGTTVRFGALVAVAVAGTLVAYARFAQLWPTEQAGREDSCQVRAGLYFTDVLVDDPDESKWAAYRACLTPVWLPRLAWLAGGLLALVLVTALLYRLFPVWRIRRSRLRRLDDFPALRDRLAGPLAELVARAGLRRPPVFLLDPAGPRAGGLAFGSRRRTYVCLDAGLVVTATRDRPAFDAIVLHELAHVRAGDVPAAYLTIAVWRAFLVVGLLPFVAVILDPWLLSHDPWHLPDGSPFNATARSMLGHAIVLVAMVFLARTAVLRARESSADALVAGWTGREEPYGTAIATPPLRRWTRWTTHPSHAARARVMRRPYLLLRPGFGEHLALGLATGVAWLELTEALRLLYWYRSGNESFAVMRTVWGLAVGGLICVLVRRGTAYRQATGRSVFALAGLALGLGLVLAALLQFFAAGATLEGLGEPAALVFAAATVAGCAALSGWAGRCAGLAGTRPSARRAAVIAAVTVLTATGVIARLYQHHMALGSEWNNLVRPALGLMRDYAGAAGDPVLAVPTLGAAVVPFLYNTAYVTVGACLAALWVVPVLLVPGLGRRLRDGVLAAAAATAVWAVLVVPLHVGGNPAAALVSSARELAAAALLQFVLAVVLTRRSGRLTAAVAVWTLAVCCTAGIWIAHLDGGVVDSALAGRPMKVLPLTGTAALLLAALVPRPRPRSAARTGSARPVVALAALLAVAAATLVYWPKASGQVELLPPEPATVPINAGQALAIWTTGGGLSRLNAVTAANSRIFAGPSTPEHYASTCRELQPVLAEAAAFPPPPAEPARSQWPEMLAAWQTAAAECVRIFGEQGPGSDLLLASFQKAQSLAAAILRQLQDATTRLVDGD